MGRITVGRFDDRPIADKSVAVDAARHRDRHSSPPMPSLRCNRREQLDAPITTEKPMTARPVTGQEAVRELYAHTSPSLALQWVERLASEMADSDNPIEVRSLGRTLRRWKQIAAWHTAQVSNGPTEAAMNNLIKRVKRVAFRLHELSQLPDQVAALRGKAAMGAAFDDHAPVKSEAQVRSDPVARDYGTSIRRDLIDLSTDDGWIHYPGGRGRGSRRAGQLHHDRKVLVAAFNNRHRR
jgi:hypothetical protein